MAFFGMWGFLLFFGKFQPNFGNFCMREGEGGSSILRPSSFLPLIPSPFRGFSPNIPYRQFWPLKIRFPPKFALKSRFPSEKMPKSGKPLSHVFLCRQSVNRQTLLGFAIGSLFCLQLEHGLNGHVRVLTLVIG